MKRSGKIALFSLGALCAALAAAPLRAQLPSIPQHKIDSLYHPATVEGGRIMQFDARQIDAGRLNEEDAPSNYVFRWHNAGDKPIVVTRVQTTCGCAVATFDRQPILPGDEGRITVTYHPKGHPGSIQRRIFVFTQLSDKLPTAVLELTGRVEPARVPTWNYPYAMGDLRLKQQGVRIAGIRIQAERIECLNAGKEPLRITAERELLPAYIVFESDPEIIEPGKTGDLIIRFDPEKAPARLPEQFPVILKGIDLPPSQRTIRVRFATNE